MKKTDGRAKSWNRGHTKDTHPSVLKISRTMASKPRSNFWHWQQTHKPEYKTFGPSKELAELYGNILGDGNLHRFPRTERLIISFNRKERDHIARVGYLIEALFGKKPTLRVSKVSNCDDLSVYQKYLSSRLGIPARPKRDVNLRIPTWIRSNHEYLKHCLKGLFESDGSWTIAPSNSTSVIAFRNINQTLLDDIYDCLRKLGYHPQRRAQDVRIARIKEAEHFARWIGFRTYQDCEMSLEFKEEEAFYDYREIA